MTRKILFSVLLLVAVVALSASPQTNWTTPPSGIGAPTGGCVPAQTYTDVFTGNNWLCSSVKVWALTPGNTPAFVIRGVSGGIGGAPMAAGACVTNSVTVTGALPSMVASVSPVSDPAANSGFYLWYARVSTINTATIYLCATIAGTPVVTAYQVSINP